MEDDRLSGQTGGQRGQGYHHPVINLYTGGEMAAELDKYKQFSNKSFHRVNNLMLLLLLQFSRLDSPCVPRSWAGASLGCSATNNNISQPAHTSVRLKIHGDHN